MFKRKNVLLMNGDKPVEINLDIFDNYKSNIECVGDNKITKMETITIFFGIKCTHVKFIELIPFSQKVVPISEVDIDDIYY